MRGIGEKIFAIGEKTSATIGEMVELETVARIFVTGERTYGTDVRTFETVSKIESIATHGSAPGSMTFFLPVPTPEMPYPALKTKGSFLPHFMHPGISIFRLIN